MMRILLVEDDADFSGELATIVAKMPGQNELELVISRDAAIETLDSDYYDLLILDLKIPPVDEAKTEASAVHGDAVFKFARAVAPGMPIIVLTASSGEDFVETMLGEAEKIDIWGTGKPASLIQFCKKAKFNTFPAQLAPVVEAVNSLSVVELNSNISNLKPEYDRLIRIFARSCGGVLCEVSRLGGLSSALVARLKVTDASGAKLHSAVVKLGNIKDVKAEAQKYDTLITRLSAEATPRKVAVHEYGAKASAGVFYQLASEDFTENGFSLAEKNSEFTSALAPHVKTALGPWAEGVPQSQHSIADIRKRVLSDEDLALIVEERNLAWVQEFEQALCQTQWCNIHGDLHGENILARPDASGVLIDYGDVGLGPRVLDPITLEFSLLFHPKSSVLNGAWPSVDQCKKWYDLEAYLVGCPCPEFVTSMRKWASEVAVSKRELAATSYAYFLRQLKYKTTDGAKALALIEGSRNLAAAT